MIVVSDATPIIGRPRVYLDCCCYNRPFDDQTQFRINLETKAKLRVQQMLKEGKLGLAWSYVLDYETGQNPFEEKRDAIFPWKEVAEVVVDESDAIIAFAKELVAVGVKAYDALHLGLA